MGDTAYSYRAKGELPLFPKKIDPGRTRTYNLRRSLSSWNPMRYQLHSLSKTRVCATFSAPNLTIDAEPYKNGKCHNLTQYKLYKYWQHGLHFGPFAWQRRYKCRRSLTHPKGTFDMRTCGRARVRGAGARSVQRLSRAPVKI